MDILKWNTSINKHKTRKHAANNLNLWNHLKFARNWPSYYGAQNGMLYFSSETAILFCPVRFPLFPLPWSQMGLGLLVCSWLTRLLWSHSEPGGSIWAAYPGITLRVHLTTVRVLEWVCFIVHARRVWTTSTLNLFNFSVFSFTLN